MSALRPEILVCAATEFELAAFPEPVDNDGVTLVVTGVGVPLTLINLLTRSSSERPDLLLNIGIAGAYPNSGIAIGDIAVADGESWGDIGFELPESPGFRSIIETQFGSWYADSLPTIRPPEWSAPVSTDAAFRQHFARGCTVNSCAGLNATGALRGETAGFETMEGAAVAAVGRLWNVPVCEIRAISNSAARRDMRPENIKLALSNLRRYLAACREAK